MKKTTFVLSLMVVSLLFLTACSKSEPVTPNGNTAGAEIEGTPAGNNDEKTTEVEPQTGEIKEFSMESFTKIIDGKYYPQFSLKEITVKKGDRVRIKITDTAGVHDFKIDELNVYAPTPLNEAVTVEFVASKSGEFAYYCTKPGHRQAGQFGTLKVIE